jgi:hypothetical protein
MEIIYQGRNDDNYFSNSKQVPLQPEPGISNSHSQTLALVSKFERAGLMIQNRCLLGASIATHLSMLSTLMHFLSPRRFSDSVGFDEIR